MARRRGWRLRCPDSSETCTRSMSFPYARLWGVRVRSCSCRNPTKTYSHCLSDARDPTTPGQPRRRYPISECGHFHLPPPLSPHSTKCRRPFSRTGSPPRSEPGGDQIKYMRKGFYRRREPKVALLHLGVFVILSCDCCRRQQVSLNPSRCGAVTGRGEGLNIEVQSPPCTSTPTFPNSVQFQPLPITHTYTRHGTEQRPPRGPDGFWPSGRQSRHCYR
jgi:hypothetical protein